MDATNPYEPPSASIANHDGAGVSAVRRSRWGLLRWLPATLCGHFALILAALGGFYCWKAGQDVIGRFRPDRVPLGALALLGFGVLWLLLSVGAGVAAWGWAGRRWGRAALATGVVATLFPISVWALGSQTFRDFVAQYR